MKRKLECDEMKARLENAVCDCERIRTDLALYAGGDLDDPVAVSQVRGHLAGCNECRQTLAELTVSLDVLQTCRASSAVFPKANLWPAVSRRLPARVSSTAAARFNLWVPTAAMTAACAAMILVTIVQLERVAPFEPTVTPHVRTVIRGQRPPDLFLAPEFVKLRDPHIRQDPPPVSLPVGLPAGRPARDSHDREW